MNLFQKIRKEIKESSGSETVSVPEQLGFGSKNNEFFKVISKRALKLYERQCDVKRFSQLVLSDPENLSHNDFVEELFDEGVKDYLDDNNLDELVNNEYLLRDLEIFE